MRGCCSRNIRQGVFLSTVIFMAFVGLNFCVVLYFYTDQSTFAFVHLIKEIIADEYAYVALLLSGLTVSMGVAILVIPPSAGLVTPMKVYTAMTVICAISWLVYSFMLTRNLSYYFFKTLPSTLSMQYAVNKGMQAKSGGGKLGALALGSAALAGGNASNSVYIDALTNIIGYPMAWLIDVAINPVLLVTTMGVPPCIVSLSTLGVFLAYADVMAEGGDGTEFVGPGEIEWFYSLRPSKQGRVTAARGHLTDDSDSDDSDDSDEKSDEGVSLKPPTRVQQHKKVIEAEDLEAPAAKKVSKKAAASNKGEETLMSDEASPLLSDTERV